MTKNEIIAALKKQDKWECDNKTYHNIDGIYCEIEFNDDYKYISYDLHPSEDIWINIANIPFNNCNLIDSIPMKSGKTYSAIICKLPGITIEVEL